jgi:hypothetical protein
MIKRLAATALVLAGVLGVVSLAIAQCAWVLWPKTLDGDFTQSLLVYDNRQECERFRRGIVQSWNAEEEAKKWGSAQRAHPDHWRCLPDTIDPRGSKR